MKYNLLIFLLVTLFFSGSDNNKTSTKVIIQGQVIGDIPDKVEYTDPILGSCYPGFRLPTYPDSTGYFTIELDIEEATFMRLSVHRKLYKTMIIEPGKTYNTKIKLGDTSNALVVLDESEALQVFYNEFPFPGHIQVGARVFDTIPDLERKMAKADEALKMDLQNIEQFTSSRKVSEDVLNLMIHDRKTYYTAIKGTMLFVDMFRADRLMPGRAEMWEDLFEVDPLTEEDIRSCWFYDVVDNYLMFKRYTAEDFDGAALNKIFEEGKGHTLCIEEIHEHLSGVIALHHEGIYLFYAALQNKFEKELIGLYDDFMERNPQNAYAPFIEQRIYKIREFYNKKEGNYSNKVQFVSNSDKMNTLDEVISSLAGNKIYIDVWASWCGPCKREFEYKKEIKPLLEENEIALLYLSIDKAEDEQKWKDLIKYYELDGFHLRANEALYRDLAKIYDQGGYLSIPWYMLVNANGELKFKEAARPSQKEQLAESIKQL